MIAQENERIADIRLPEEFLSRMRQLLTENEYAAFLSSYGQKRRYSLRVNPLKADRTQVLQLLQRSAEDTLLGRAESESGGILPPELLQPVPWEPDGFYYPEEFRPGRLSRHEAGMYYIQEASAMAPAVLCGVRPGERVLDLCAAPGGKSTKLAACLQGRGLLVANEIHPERAKILSSNLERMGVRNVLVTNETPQRLACRFPLFFDRIVVDAPCSGEGMFRKEEEALQHWSPENVRMCADRQAQILEEAASMLRPGGRLVYSTCTFSPEENEGTIFRFLQKHRDFSVVPAADLPDVRIREWGFAPGRPEWIPAEALKSEETFKDAGEAFKDAEEAADRIREEIRGTVRLWPFLLDGEGHYAAVLRKEGDGRQLEETGESSLVGTVSCSASQNGISAFSSGKTAGGKKGRKKEKAAGRKRGGKKGGKADPKKEEAVQLWREFCRETLSFSFPEERLLLFGETLYALPLPADALSLEGLRVLRPGLQLGDIARGRFTPSHSLGMALTDSEVLRAVHLEGDSEQAYAWLRGEAIPLAEGISKGWCLVLIDGCAAGWGKAAGSMLKNHYPRGLRKGSSYRPESGPAGRLAH